MTFLVISPNVFNARPWQKGRRPRLHVKNAGPRLSRPASPKLTGCDRALPFQAARDGTRRQGATGRRYLQRAQSVSPLAVCTRFPAMHPAEVRGRLPSFDVRLSVGCEAGVEPATARVTVSCSTTELVALVEFEGIEPSTSHFRGRSTAELKPDSSKAEHEAAKQHAPARLLKPGHKAFSEERALAATLRRN